MKIGFTGSREQPTADQKRNFRQWMTENHPEELHHGCCQGADAFAAFIGAGRTRKCVGHPPIDKTLLDQHAVDLSDVCREPAEYLIRNQHIVDETDLLIAMPKGPEEQRSGTWATIRAARRAKKPIILFMPDGRILAEDEIKNLQPSRGK